MRREADARRLLHQLLDRMERNPDSVRRVIARASSSFESSDAHRRLDETLLAARDAGAVEIIFDREAPHLIDRVVLADPKRLYAHLGRESAQTSLGAALSILFGIEVSTDIGRELVDYFIDRWRVGKSALALSPVEIDEALRLIRAADAAFTELPGGRVPLRTRSARLLNDSKALERSLSKLISFLKEAGRIDPELQREDVLRVLGLEKYPQPLLLVGPLLVGDLSIGDWTYVGLPPDAGEVLNLAGPVRSILTVENLESFNRHVRECRLPEDIVVYTGGFPSNGTIAVLRRLIMLSAVDGIWHWGDIDGGGVRIGRYLERMLPTPVAPHLMTAELASASGIPSRSPKDMRDIPSESAFAPLAAYLRTPTARWLEQEVLDPQWVSPFPKRQVWDSTG